MNPHSRKMPALVAAMPVAAPVVTAVDRHTGMRSLRWAVMSRAISWKKVLVVRPQPGQAVTCGAKERRPSDCSTCCAT